MQERSELAPARINTWLVALLIVLSGLQFLILPIWLLPLDPTWGWLLVPTTLSTLTFWAVVHEAIHGNLLAGKRLNDGVGRVLCVLFGSPFQLLRLGHLMHHRFNRTPIQRPEISSAGSRPTIAETVKYYSIVLGGLYLLELIASLLALLPKRPYAALVRFTFGEHTPDGKTMLRAAETQLLSEPGRTRMRVDGFFICLLLGASFWLYGSNWWMLCLAILARAFLVSFFDNAYHYGNRLDDVQAGYNLRLPKWAACALLNFNLHGVHHRHPTLPWSELPRVFEREGDRYHLDYLSAAIRQLRGMIPEAAAAEGAHDSRRPKTRRRVDPPVHSPGPARPGH